MPYIRKKYLQNRITAGQWTLPAAILLSLSGWIGAWWLLSERSYESPMSLFSIVCYALIGYFLVVLNNSFTLIRMRASVQTAAYLLLAAAIPILHTTWKANVASIMMLVSLYFLFRSYQKSYPMTDIFHSFLFLGVGSLCLPQLTWITPLLFIGTYLFQSLCLKSFFAALLGWGLPYLSLLGYTYLSNQMELFTQLFGKIFQLQPLFNGYEPWLLVSGGYLLLLFTVSAIHCFANSYEDKLRTRSYLNYLVFFTFCLFLWMTLLPNMGKEIMLLLLPIVSILGGHFFALTRNRFSNIFFLFMLVLLIPLFIFNLWMLL